MRRAGVITVIAMVSRRRTDGGVHRQGRRSRRHHVAITIEAEGQATVECTNPGGNVAPGQTFGFTALGTTTPLLTPKNGQFVFSIATDEPPPPPPDSCPNPQWSAAVVDVVFTTVTLTVYEDGDMTDQIVVAVK